MTETTMKTTRRGFLGWLGALTAGLGVARRADALPAPSEPPPATPDRPAHDARPQDMKGVTCWYDATAPGGMKRNEHGDVEVLYDLSGKQRGPDAVTADMVRRLAEWERAGYVEPGAAEALAELLVVSHDRS